MMRNTVIGRILLYFAIWISLFLILCIVSVVKNWEVMVAMINGTLSSLIGSFLIIGLVIYSLVLLIVTIFR